MSLNDLVNDPLTLQAIAPGTPYIDMEAWLDLERKWFGYDHKVLWRPPGAGVFLDKGGGLYEAHQFYPRHCRGRAALWRSRDMLREMFTNPEVECIEGNIPRSNRAARHMTRQLGFENTGTTWFSSTQGIVIRYVMDRDRWDQLSAES